MNELINTTRNQRGSRQRLLNTASALVLLMSVSGAVFAKASDDMGHPTIWIELGGQLERVDGGQEAFVPPFLQNSPRASVWHSAPQSVERPSRYAVGGEGKITLEPQGANWRISATVRYGRSNSDRSVAQQTVLPSVPLFGFNAPAPPKIDVADEAHGATTESHAILDFTVGRDVGLGLPGSTSAIGAGVRFAQFNQRSNVTLKSRPWVAVAPPLYINYKLSNFFASSSNTRDFRGIGPSLSWDGSVPLAGNADDAQFTLDWGVNAAVLFGRQKTRTQHLTSGTYASFGYFGNFVALSNYQHPHNRTQSHSVIVPNVGGFVGLSVKFPNAKVSLGYRADFFFGAMDGGIDTRKTYDRNFYGPFATISIDLGG